MSKRVISSQEREDRRNLTEKKLKGMSFEKFKENFESVENSNQLLRLVSNFADGPIGAFLIDKEPIPSEEVLRLSQETFLAKLIDQEKEMAETITFLEESHSAKLAQVDYEEHLISELTRMLSEDRAFLRELEDALVRQKSELDECIIFQKWAEEDLDKVDVAMLAHRTATIGQINNWQYAGERLCTFFDTDFLTFCTGYESYEELFENPDEILSEEQLAYANLVADFFMHNRKYVALYSDKAIRDLLDKEGIPDSNF